MPLQSDPLPDSDQLVGSTAASSCSNSGTDQTTTSTTTADTHATLASSSIAKPPLSKSAQKKIAKEALWHAQKLERRQREKVAKKEKRLAQVAAAHDHPEGSDGHDKERERKRKKVEGTKRFARIEAGEEGEEEGDWFRARIVVDLGFDDLMVDKEIKSMSAQLAFLYNNHRTSTSPFRSVLFTRLEGKLKSRLQDSYWQTAKGRWRGVECWDGQEMDGLWNEEGGEMWTSAEEEQGDGGLMEQSSSILKSAPIEPEAITTGEYDSSMQQTLQASDTVPPVASSASISAPTHPHPLIGRLPSRSPRDSVIYLTADSPNEITELEEGMTYVIGGIVDHNRYKNLCLDKANKLGIQTARLPIGTYLSSLPTRKVLTVNQVFEILTTWVTLRDWEATLTKIIPARKFEVVSRHNRGGRPMSNPSGTGDEEAEEEYGNGKEEQEEVARVAKDGEAKVTLTDEEMAMNG